MAEGRAELNRIADLEARVRRRDQTRVADLTAALRVKRRPIENDGPGLAFAQALDALAALGEQIQDAGVGLERLVAEKRRRLLELRRVAAGRLEAARFTRALALVGHERVEARLIDTEIALARDVGGEVLGKPVGIVELEDRLARNHAGRRELRDRVLEQPHPLAQGLGEALLLLLQHALDVRPPRAELGIDLAHLPLEARNELVEERLLDTELVAVPDCAPNDSPQDVAATLVTRKDPVGDQERAGADVVGDDAQRFAVKVGRTRHGRGRFDQMTEEIDLVVRMHALHDGREALEPHARIDRGFRQRFELAVRVALELHEDEVPDFYEPIAVFVGASGRAAGDLAAVVVENLAARAARTGVAHGPEVVLLPHAREPALVDTDFVEPDRGGLVVVPEDRAKKPVRRQAEHFGHELPGIVDRLALEVVAEAEIAEHLEERVMSGRVADVLEIVVLAAGAHAALRRRGARNRPRLASQEDVLELHHPRIREQQRRIVDRHERRARNDLVAALGEVVEEGSTQFVSRIPHCSQFEKTGRAR